jgi:hypothetical protein
VVFNVVYLIVEAMCFAKGQKRRQQIVAESSTEAQNELSSHFIACPVPVFFSVFECPAGCREIKKFRRIGLTKVCRRWRSKARNLWAPIGHFESYIQTELVSPIYVVGHSTTLTNSKPSGWVASL